MEKNGIIIECLPQMEPLSQQVIDWLSDYIAKNPFDMNQDLKKLQQNQPKIMDFLCKKLDLKTPSETLKHTIPQIFSKFQNAGNVIPNIRHLQIWYKKDLKTYLDNGGKIPGYAYKPGADGENELFMEQGVQTDGKNPAQDMTINSPLFPLILKSDDPAKYFDEAKTTLTEMHQQFQKMSSGMAGLILMMAIQPAIQMELRSPMRYFNWFTSGTAGYLTGQILNDFISEETAKRYIESQSIKPFIRLLPQVHLVKWIGDDTKNSKRTPEDEILKRARYAFSIYEIMGLVRRNGPDAIPKIMANLHKNAPADKKKTESIADAQSFESDVLIKDLDVLINAIQATTGENFRPRLIQYSQYSPESESSSSTPTQVQPQSETPTQPKTTTKTQSKTPSTKSQSSKKETKKK